MASKTSVGQSSFGQTLHFITDIKLEELEKQRLAYREHAKVLDESKVLGDKGDILKKVEILAEAVKSWTGSGALGGEKIVGSKLQTGNLDFWLQQARRDPGFSLELAQGWAETLEEHIKHNLMRFDSAKLFGSLFNEWIASGDSVALTYQAGPDSETDKTAYVEVGRKEMQDQSAKFKSIVFEDYPIDVEQLNDYLQGLFSSEEAGIALNSLRKELGEFGSQLQRRPLNATDVRHTIVGLLSTALMDEEKRTTLKAFLENPTVLDEVASVLNMRMASIETWKWPREGILVEFRRHLNGKYRAFTDPEIIDALFLHYIGVAWQVQLKKSLLRVFDSKAWISPGALSYQAKQAYKTQLVADPGHSINGMRNTSRRRNFFVMQLQDNASRPHVYDDLVDAPRTDKRVIGPVMVKQKLLQIMTTESYLNTTLHGTHAAVCSDLEWFGPSLPHATVLTVLKFLGISQPWLDFYEEFLSTPLRFPAELEPRIRKRGTPISYSLSALCGEAVIFIMDFAVNQHANGLFLYRLHDDLWLWDSDVKKVATGWQEMERYASLVGLKFNESKTGSAYVGLPSNNAIALLPKGTVRWGFLKFDVEACRFVLDQNDVGMHIAEIRRQLGSTRSVFGWVNAYNKYMAFFLRNLGGIPANCFGEDHVNDVIDTLARVQRELFPAEGGRGGSAVAHLRKTLQERFGITDLPEGYFYLPIGSGGLELRNTMLEILALQRGGKPLVDSMGSDIEGTFSTSDLESYYNICMDSVSSKPFKDLSVVQKQFLGCMLGDGTRYALLKEYWQNQNAYKKAERTGNGTDPSSGDVELVSFDEYTSLRESYLTAWGYCYSNMLQTPSHCSRSFKCSVNKNLGCYGLVRTMGGEHVRGRDHQEIRKSGSSRP